MTGKVVLPMRLIMSPEELEEPEDDRAEILVKVVVKRIGE